jgi:hypothetical protein
MAQQKTLQDFERVCQQVTNVVKRERIALEARDFLIQMAVLKSIAEQINQLRAEEGELNSAKWPVGKLKRVKSISEQFPIGAR